jgi:hypothetical protein
MFLFKCCWILKHMMDLHEHNFVKNHIFYNNKIHKK